MREDPLELAWAPAARPRLHATAAASQLHSGEGHRVGEAAVLGANSAEQLAGSGPVEEPSGRGRGNTARRLQQTSADVAAEEGATEQRPAQVAASGGSSAATARLGLLQSSLSGGSGGVGGVGGAGSGPPAGVGLGAGREQQVEEMLSRLQALPWRRVDVCFGATLLPLLSHQHIQARREGGGQGGLHIQRHGTCR